MKPDTIKTYTIKPGDTIVAKVDGIERTCIVYAVTENFILATPIRTNRHAPYEGYFIIPHSAITKIHPGK